MACSGQVDPDGIREAIAQCPDAGSDPWIVGLSIETTQGERIEGGSIYLSDPDTAAVLTTDGEIRLAVSQITRVLVHLQSPGPE